MLSLYVTEMTILRGGDTKAVSVIASTFTKNEILIGHKNGNIHLWRFLDMIRGYIDDHIPIVYIHALSRSEFLSANKKGTIKIWNINNCTIKKKIFLSWWIPDCIVMLPNNLLAFSRFCPGRSIKQTVEVWDIKSGARVHEGFHDCSNARGMPIDTTIAGYLVVATTFGKRMCIWDVSKKRCKLICRAEVDIVFSLAALPTNEIVTAARNIVIYKLTQYGDIFKSKVIENKNIIDIIIPVGGFKFLTVDRSRNHAGIMKLWYCSSEKYEYLGHSKTTGVPKLVSSWYNVIFSYKQDKVFIKHYDSEKLGFSRKLAEIRKNVRILAQALRTSTSWFIILPIEITIKIAVMTAHGMNQYEKKVCQDFAWSHFCRPHYCDTYIREKDYLRDCMK